MHTFGRLCKCLGACLANTRRAADEQRSWAVGPRRERSVHIAGSSKARHAFVLSCTCVVWLSCVLLYCPPRPRPGQGLGGPSRGLRGKGGMSHHDDAVVVYERTAGHGARARQKRGFGVPKLGVPERPSVSRTRRSPVDSEADILSLVS